MDYIAISVLQVSSWPFRGPWRLVLWCGTGYNTTGLEVDFVKVDPSLGCSWTHKRLMYKLEFCFIYSKESYHGHTDLNVQVS